MKSMTREHKNWGIHDNTSYAKQKIDISKQEKGIADHWKVLQQLVEPLPRSIIWKGNGDLHAT
jgi:3-polyprenyl-4-hydroxybenzoate decarboxylase